MHSKTMRLISKSTRKNQQMPEVSKMFQFIRELSMIYSDESDESKGLDSSSELLNLNDTPVYKSFEFIDNAKGLKGFREKEKTSFKLNGKNDWNDPLDIRRDSVSETDVIKARKKVYVKGGLDDYSLPEMVAFFGDTNCNLVKDITMDSESVRQGYCWVEDYESDNCNLSSSVPDDAVSSDSTKETLRSLSSIMKGLETEAEDEEECEDKILDVMNDQNPAETVHQVKDECRNNFAGLDTVWIEKPAETTSRNGYERLTVEDEDKPDGRTDVWVDSWNQKIMRDIHEIEENLQIRVTAVAPSNTISSSTPKSERYKSIRSHAYMESGGESADSNTEAAELIWEAEQDCCRIPKTEKPEIGTLAENIKRSSQCSSARDSDVESSSIIEADDLPSGPISHSSSSTGSGRSFTFPVLPLEWPGSPVKMPIADRKEGSPMAIYTWRRSQSQSLCGKQSRERHSRWRVFFCFKSILRK